MFANTALLVECGLSLVVAKYSGTVMRMLPREAENGVGMNRSARGGKCKAL